MVEAVHRDVEPRLALVAVTEVAHPQRRRVRRVDALGRELLQPVHVAALQERRADRRRVAEQVEDDPAVAAVVAQQREVRVGAESLPGVAALEQVGKHRPGMLGKRVIEVDAGDGLHDPAVAQPKPAAIDGLHPADVRRTVFGDRDALVALDRARHAGRPEQLVAQVPIDELVQVAEVLGQFPGLGKGRRHQLDQRLGIVGRDVLVGQRRAQRLRVGRRGDPASRRDPEGFLLDALEPALERGGGTAVHETRQAAFKTAIDGHAFRARVRARDRKGSRKAGSSPPSA